jgi:hypothetical protein
LVEEDPWVIPMLKKCGMWNFFQFTFMRAQPRLLNNLIDYWHPDVEVFMLERQSLTPTTKDIYIFYQYLQEREPFNLRNFLPGLHNIEDYIGMYYKDSTKKIGSQVSVHKITSVNLQIVLYMIGQIMRYETLQQDSCAQMHCENQCLHATIFDWSTMMLTCMKKKLTECRRRTNKKFEFGTMMCAFVFERVPILIP